MHMTQRQNQKNRIRTALPFLLLAFFLVLSVPSAFANILGNPNFEDPIGNGSGGNWDGTNGATRVDNATKPGPVSNIPNGQFALRLQPAAGQFTFQIYNNVKPGDFVTFSAIAESGIAPAGGRGGQMVIEFKTANPISGSDNTFATVQSALITNVNAVPGGGFQTFTIQGVAPPGTNRVAFTLRTVNGGAGYVIFDQTNAEINPAKLTLAASKTQVGIGDMVGIFAHFTNASGNTLTNTELRFKVPYGFSYVKDSVKLNGRQAAFREGSLIIPAGTLLPGDTFDASFVLATTGGVQIGKEYEVNLEVFSAALLSEKASVRLFVKGDPVFEEGTIIGKVFNDLNQNTVQDKGEEGVPWVRLYTEEGIGIVTDEYGRYHIPGVKPGRHIIKIDGHTLPQGTKFITEESFLVHTTEGIMNKANFAILLPPSKIPQEFQKDLKVMVTQGVDVSTPKLDVTMTPDVVKVGIGVLEKEPVFKFDLNYGDFIKKWSLEIRDEMGREVWTGYGVSKPPPEVVWSGITESGLVVKPGIYSYQLKVRDAKNREDWTTLKFFQVFSKLDPKAEKNYETEIPPIGDFNLFKDGKRSIPLVAKPTLRVQGKTKPDYEVRINDTPVSVDPESGFFQKEFYAEPGEREILVTSTTPSGETISYREKIKVKDSTFFMVALGDQQLGANWTHGQLESAGQDSSLRHGFSQDGRLSYFLKGKLKGKFLVKSKYDTDDKSSSIFTNLDPDDYYPIYGDGSVRDYDAKDTEERFYVLVEFDRSFVKWGSFKTEFNDTEMASYNRTLSGLKVNYDTVGTTVYGDPKRGFKLFWTQTKHIADHNELMSTGGSLYYTRYRNMLEGSEKIRVEIRDKIQDMTISSYDLSPGLDYEIDYKEGRILLSRSLSSVAATDTLTTADLLDGNNVYLVVDYEYEPQNDTMETPNQGIRGYTHLGDHIRLGATGIEEKRPGDNYQLRAVDLTVKMGRNTKLTAEYAETHLQQTEQAVSFDGGISYATLSTLKNRNSRYREQGYLIKAESKPVTNLDLSGYLQGVDPGFSNDHMRSQEGLKKYGVTANYKWTENLSTRYRFDSSNPMEELMPLEEQAAAVPYNRLQTHTAQIVYDDGKYLAQAEYQRRNFETPINTDNLVPSLLSEVPFENGISGKVGYHINDRLLPYVKAQTTFDGKGDHQFGGGLRYEIFRNLFAYVEQMFGKIGDSTYFGFEKQHGNGGRTYLNLRSYDRGIGDRTLATAIGNSFSLSEKSRVYSEREYSSYQGVDGFSDILGYDGKVGDRWDYGGKYERRHLLNSTTRLLDQAAQEALARANTFNTVGGYVAYAEGKKFRARAYVEVRRDQDAPKMGQLVMRHSVQYQITQDLGFLTRFNYGSTHLLDPDDHPAGFVEFSTGFAYRPIACDKLNILTRYTYIKDIANDEQFNNGLYQGMEFDEAAHIVSLDGAYDVNRYFGIVEKFAWKRSTAATSVGDDLALNTFLSANRINFHVTRKWDVALEYRILWQSSAAETLRHGTLVEIDREIYEYVRIGVGYNFTDFSDDLRHANNYRSQGPFVRLLGKF